ncbi:hypothetical protein GLW07_21085 [Bacillus hwajinpoensis]|jgi:hypothetical protein|uniref:Uncharacterized protein n=1 Tax=Guptibacillus hwajinpoensis TaxID=208199 RepID=A0A845F547_9BACL|nr:MULTISPECIES: hypothetical protein [Bacillaceae]MCA0993583.1 hypothetical protein [Pseudalkalibacillus hwajinpoensis]MYL65844.1 hypothetical protein [Pseudalkalibacillus hwajinpoensis]QHA90156.1 hypothetical protein GNK04_00935 [Bacillus sp. N1-1]
MMGFLVNFKEMKEIEYLLKREMEELLLDLDNSRIDGLIKRAMEERYQLLLGIYKRTATQAEIAKYVRILKKSSN